MAFWWRRPPARPPTIFRPMARSRRSRCRPACPHPDLGSFRPRRWRAAPLLPQTAPGCASRSWKAAKRPVSAVADDFRGAQHVSAVDVTEDRSIAMTMLYDAGHNLDERYSFGTAFRTSGLRPLA